MPAFPPPTINNLLRTLSADDAALLEAHLEPVELEHRFVLERPQMPIGHVYFPNSGIASIVAAAGRDRLVEVGLFGREGMSGSSVVLGNDRSPVTCFMQLAGNGQRIASDRLRQAMSLSPSLSRVFLNFVNSLLIQTEQTALANAQARLEVRLCRWLLMCHDRVEGDTLPLTHQFLATMLGVRRAGVTTTLHLLEDRGFIRATRGSIRIVGREGMVKCAAGLYGVPEAEYKRLIGVSLSGR